MMERPQKPWWHQEISDLGCEVSEPLNFGTHGDPESLFCAKRGQKVSFWGSKVLQMMTPVLDKRFLASVSDYAAAPGSLDQRDMPMRCPRGLVPRQSQYPPKVMTSIGQEDKNLYMSYLLRERNDQWAYVKRVYACIGIFWACPSSVLCGCGVLKPWKAGSTRVFTTRGGWPEDGPTRQIEDFRPGLSTR